NLDGSEILHDGQKLPVVRGCRNVVVFGAGVSADNSARGQVPIAHFRPTNGQYCPAVVSVGYKKAVNMPPADGPTTRNRTFRQRVAVKVGSSAWLILRWFGRHTTGEEAEPYEQCQTDSQKCHWGPSFGRGRQGACKSSSLVRIDFTGI